MKTQSKQPFSCEVMTITPQMAKNWLDNSGFENRRIEEGRIKKLIKDIKVDKWIFDGTPIRFNGKEDIIDGQHRLQAIAQAGKPVKSLVIKGLDTTSKNTIDTGKSRTIGDVLHFNGQVNSTTLAAAARLAIGYRTYKGDLTEWSKVWGGAAISNQEILEEALTNQKIVKAVQSIISLKYTRKIAGGGVAAFCYYLFMETAIHHLADHFFQGIEHGNDLSQDSPILILRNTLSIRDSKSWTNGRRRASYTVALFIKAWNAWRTKETIKVLKYGFEETYPRPVK